MLTNPVILQSPLRWSEFPITYNWTDVVFEFTVTLVTRSLSMNVVPDGRLERLQLIDTLYKRELNSAEIANYLNERGILTPSGKAYYPKLVWMTQDKFKKRATRWQTKRLEISRLDFTLQG